MGLVKYIRSYRYYCIRLLIRTSLIMISAYIMRNIIGKIPSFFDGLYGYKHARNKEMAGGVIIAFSIIALQKGYEKDIDVLAKKAKKKYPIKYLRLDT